MCDLPLLDSDVMQLMLKRHLLQFLVFFLQFVESIQLHKKPFHLMGTSMGGNVAGVYAARYPSDLCSLTLICPAGLCIIRVKSPFFIFHCCDWKYLNQLICYTGLKNPVESTFVKRLRDLEKNKDTHGIPLIPSTPEEMEEMLKLCSFVRFKIPQQVSTSQF